MSPADDNRDTYDAIGTDIRTDYREGPAEGSKELCCDKDISAAFRHGIRLW